MPESNPVFDPGWGMRLRIMLTTVLVFGVITGVVGFILYASGIAGSGSLVFWIAISLIMVGVQWWFGPTIIKWATKAREIKREESPDLFEMVESLARKAGLPMPNLYIVNNPSPNAFAFGRTQSDSHIAVHSGLLHALSRSEIEGVLAHELGHINNRDVSIMTVASILPVMLYYGVLIFSPRGRDDGFNIGTFIGAFAAQFVGQLMVMWLSRSREYFADEFSARLTGNPVGLMSALAKISYGPQAGKKSPSNSMVKALYFSGPPTGGMNSMELAIAIESEHDEALMRAIESEKKKGLFEFLSTHPLTAKRLEHLLKVKRQMAS